MAALLVKVSGDGKAFIAQATQGLAGGKVDVTPILSVTSTGAGPGVAAATASTWLRVASRAQPENPWDEAHALLAAGAAFTAAGGSAIEAVEPDRAQQWIWRPLHADGAGIAVSGADVCAFDDQDGAGGKAKGPGPAWNFIDDYSQLKKAREDVGAAQAKIVIAHLDTGYDPTHVTLPANLSKELQRSFVTGENPGNAVDQVPPGAPFANRGHGPGTLSLLSGNHLGGDSPGFPGFEDWLGGAPQAKIIPVRIADSVVRFSTATMVQGFDYAREKGAHVLSMSMGGLSSQALADAVNLAYEAGLVMVTAAGNNFAWVPSPKTIVFPARFNRVLAACGVMADGRAYAGLSPGEMQGNYGPVDKMDTALGAYTPNTPWAKIGCVKTVDMNGAGTSAATPQIAAAAALWLAAHWDEISAYPQAWMRVEAVRRALFDSAHKSTPRMDPTETQEKLGRGVMQAAEALKLTPRHASELKKSPPARASWPWLELIFGTGGVSVAANGRQEKMFALELTQMAQISPQVEATIVAPDADTTKISPAARNRYLEAALDEGAPSKPLREFLERHLRRDASKPGKARERPSAAPAAARAVNRPQRRSTPQEPPNRRLRIFALDPGTAKRLETLPINETTLQTPWDDVETTGEPLRPGPVGEYLEVIDVDPVSRKVYDPVDLNDRFILARDGLTPSEGNPNFHQQMVYAVAMTTIRHFEEALGRKALWAPRYETDASGRLAGREVRRLRIYPHALRTANAYYSPDKKALLFGYFPAGGDDRGATAPGNMVFACLSSDIVAHEMSHALLDGLHRRFQEASNPDVPAFHEAFADIVAVFQHFTIPELVRFEVGRHRGAIEGADLLSGVAFQFGETSGVGAALRNYGKGAAKFRRYEDTLEPHDRAQILVLAIYRAFLAIVSRRTADLIRIGSGGSGILPKGAVHPDLVERLTMEICTAARHVLRMCIRALDYCPSVDITFGEYLRALITADADLVQSDDLGYRTAFIEGFRACGVPVRDVRTLSAESVTWNAPANDQPSWLKTIFEHVDFGLDRKLTRTEMFDLNEKNRWRVWSALKEAFNRDPALCGEFGLMPGILRYDGNFGPLGPLRKNNVTTFNVFNVRPARRIAPDGSFRTDIVVVIDQRRPLFYDEKDPSQGQFWFRGGATLILDPNQGAPRIRYSIVKNIDSRSRIDIQRKTALGAHQSPMQALYFGAASFEPFAMMHSGQRDHEHG
ncbi:S8 family serine peptidase [Methylosinus sp. PW1]|uniref:S8 family serine peptidase n=1 Tax=Methylosinus sp. PW1 TaxID=107636 RepID=UPI0005642F6B|nr:S8 family serine peptidase [Methylosinus sp. PW1]